MNALIDKTFIVRFKPPGRNVETIVAASVNIEGEHLVLLNAEGKIVALLLLEAVESWSEG